MSNQKRVIICTGPPGNGRDDMIRDLKEIAVFGYHHLFQYIVEEAALDNTHLTKINILDFYDSQPEKMEQYRLKALDKILNRINAESMC